MSRQTGQDRDIAEFLTAMQPRLSRLAYLVSKDAQAAEDLVQEAMVKTVDKWRQVQRASDPTSYVCQILINTWRNQWRRKSRIAIAFVASPDDFASTADTALADESDVILDRITLAQILSELTPNQRSVLYLRFYEDWSVQKVAATLGCSEGTVKSQTSHALRALARRFDNTTAETTNQ